MKIHPHIEVPTKNTSEQIPVFIFILELTILTRIRTYINAIEHHFSDFKNDILDTKRTLEYRCTDLAAFLLSQFSTDSTINYYQRSKYVDFKAINNTLPDDIDDTFSCLYALNQYNNTFITQTKLHSVIRALINIRFDNTPHIFNTWFIKDFNNSAIWKSIDYASLSAIVAFFESIDIPVQKLHDEVFEHIIRWKKSDFYHMQALPVYLLSRCTFSNQDFRHFLKEKNYMKMNCAYTFEKDMIDCSLLWQIFQKFQGIKPITNYPYKCEVVFVQDSYAEIINIINIDRDATDLKSFFFDEFAPKNLFIEQISKSGKITYRKSDYIPDLISLEHKIGHSVLLLLLTQEDLILTSRERTLAPLKSRPYLSHHEHTLEFEEAVSIIKKRLLFQFNSPFWHTILAEGTICSVFISKVLASKDFKIIFDLSLISIHSTTPLAGSSPTSYTAQDWLELLYTHAVGLIGYNLIDKIIDNELPHLYLPFALVLINTYSSKVYEYTLQYPDNLRTKLQRIARISEKQSSYYLDQSKNIRISKHAHKSISMCISAFLFFPRLEFLEYFEQFFKKFQLARQIADDIIDYEFDLKVGKRNSLSKFQTRNINISSETNIDIHGAILYIQKLLCEAEAMIHQKDIPIQISKILAVYIKEADNTARRYMSELELLNALKSSCIADPQCASPG